MQAGKGEREQEESTRSSRQRFNREAKKWYKEKFRENKRNFCRVSGAKPIPDMPLIHLLAGRILSSTAGKAEALNQYSWWVFGEKPDDSGQNDDEMLSLLAVTKGMC